MWQGKSYIIGTGNIYVKKKKKKVKQENPRKLDVF